MPAHAITPRRLRWLLNLYPPFLCSGIHVESIAADWSRARVRLASGRLTRNYVGTHFGGSLFAMCDPFWMIMLLQRLGPDYIVWDKAGEIDFIKAVREPVWAEFALDTATVEALRARAEGNQRVLHWFETEITTADGQTVARVRKQIYVRAKR